MRKTISITTSALALVVVPAAFAAPGALASEPGSAVAQPDGSTELVSQHYSDQWKSSGTVMSPDTSADGRYVVFASSSKDLIDHADYGPDVQLWSEQIYVRDTKTGTTTRVSHAPDGRAGDGPSGSAKISADGRFVVYDSKARNLVPGDSRGVSDIFLYDRTTDTTTLVTEPVAGPLDGDCGRPDISADGSSLTFTSAASNLVSGDANGASDIFAYDVATGTTTLISKSFDGGSADSASQYSVMSGDGSVIAFESFASDLTAGDSNGEEDVFVWNHATDSVALVSQTAAGGPASRRSLAAGISADGQHIAYWSYAPGIVPEDHGKGADAFVYETSSNTTTLVTRKPNGAAANDGYPYNPVITLSADGSQVAFASRSTHLVRHDPGGTQADIFVTDLPTDRTTLVTRAADGGAADDFSNQPAMSDDGRYVAFSSFATNLGPDGPYDALVNNTFRHRLG